MSYIGIDECQCEHPLIKCDDRGCRCELCGKLERVDFPKAEETLHHAPCTCHPDDNPPVPCPHMYALNECRKAAKAAREKLICKTCGRNGWHMAWCKEGTGPAAKTEAGIGYRQSF